MKKSFITMALTAIILTGCIRPPNYDGVVQIQTNEIAFLVDMTSDEAIAGSSANVIQRKDIPIPGYFVKTGRFDWQGYWRPTLKVIAVSQAPVRREWDKMDDTQSVRMVSIESSGFVVPMIINAYIANSSDATKYLAAFRPISDENTDWSEIRQSDWHRHVKENAQPLERALDTVVYTKIMEQLSVLFVKVPILYAETTSKIFIPAILEGMSDRELNEEIRTALPSDVQITFDRAVPSLKEWALETYGITITAMAPGDGVLYDSNDVQTQIDNLAIASMRERTLNQERINAQEEQRVRDIQARTLAIEAQHQMSTIAVQRQRQEIDNTRLLAEAQSAAIRAGHYPPVPQTLITDTKLGAFGFPGLGNLME